MRDIHVFCNLAHRIILGVDPSQEAQMPAKHLSVEHSSSCVQGVLVAGGVALLSCNEESGLAIAMELGN